MHRESETNRGSPKANSKNSIRAEGSNSKRVHDRKDINPSQCKGLKGGKRVTFYWQRIGICV
jgi:hypothetical protein